MNRPRLRLARPRPAPRPCHRRRQPADLNDAIDQLPRLRTPYWLGDSAVELHAQAVRQLAGHHLAPLTDPGLVAGSLHGLLSQLQAKP